MELVNSIAPYLPFIILGMALIFLVCSSIRVVSGNEVLVVTGVGATKKVVKEVAIGKDENGNPITEERVTYEPKVRIAGASIVVPLLQRARTFDVCVEKAGQSNDTMKTVSGVEIDIDWVISFAPDSSSVETLLPAIRQFLDKDKNEIEEIIKSVVAGGVRAVISTMTPQQVMVGKDTLDEAVQNNISDQMADLGYKVQLYIQEVRDSKESTYYVDLAAEDRETTRQNAANITANADRAIRQKKAETEREAKQAEIDSELSIAERGRDASLKKAEYKIEVDTAEANAEAAKGIQAAEREKDLETKRGEVEVVRKEQENAAAMKAQEVEKTRAETEKKKQIIGAEAEAEKQKIQAEATAAVKKTEAEGEANAVKERAAGEADATKTRAAAEAEKIRATGQADADAIAAKGKAEAEAIKAKGLAEAEAEMKKAEARAANDKVNFEIQKLEIETQAQVQIATNVATAMANIGEKATFYDFSGKGAGSEASGDLLTKVMGNIPMLFKKANLESSALNGEGFNETLSSLVEAVRKAPEGPAEKPDETQKFVY